MASNSIPRRTSRSNASHPISTFTTRQPGPNGRPHRSAPLLPRETIQITHLPTHLPPQPQQHQSGPPLSGSASHAPQSVGNVPRSAGLPAQSASRVSRSASHFPGTAVLPPRAPPKQAHMTLKSLYDRFFTDWWLWEILALFLSLSTFAALVVILSVYNGRNVAQLPRGISLNAIVSILSTISKSSLIFSISATISQFKWLLFSGRTRQLKDLQLYDDASRGPLGSSLLLLSEKGLYVGSRVHIVLLLISQSSWASIGALITILVLALDPFFQQLIHVSNRMVYHDSPSVTVKQAVDVAELGPSKSSAVSGYSCSRHDTFHIVCILTKCHRSERPDLRALSCCGYPRCGIRGRPGTGRTALLSNPQLPLAPIFFFGLLLKLSRCNPTNAAILYFTINSDPQGIRCRSEEHDIHVQRPDGSERLLCISALQ